MHDPTITPESLIETRGLSRAAILATLFNAASKTGHGKKNPGPDTITETEAEAIFNSYENAGRLYFYFEYLYGKRLKIDLTMASDSGIIAGQYDYGQGRGTAKAAIDALRRTGDPCHPDIIALKEKSRAATEIAAAPLPDSGTTQVGNLAESMGLIDWSTKENPDLEFEHLQRIPCTTIKL